MLPAPSEWQDVTCRRCGCRVLVMSNALIEPGSYTCSTNCLRTVGVRTARPAAAAPAPQPELPMELLGAWRREA